MKSKENKVLEKSDYFLYTANDYTKKMFFYPVSVGHFFYEPDYRIARDRFDSFLIMLITEGSVDITTHSADVGTAVEGDVVLLDCYRPHAYGSRNAWSTLWIHFDGPTAREQYEYLVNAFGNIIRPRDHDAVEHTLYKIFNIFKDKAKVRDAGMSKYITNILTELFLSNTTKNSKSLSSLDVDGILSYINENYDQELPLEHLAERCNLSPYYFTRVFTEATGVTPHRYVITTRINAAKFLLKTTTLSVKEVAYHSGFNSSSVFCTTFKKNEHITPSKYRQMSSLDPETFSGNRYNNPPLR